MLYLPSIRICDIEVRLPASADAVLRLCRYVSEESGDNSQIRTLLAEQPGLLVFAIATNLECREGKRIRSFDDLCLGLAKSIFTTEIESDAFEQAKISQQQWATCLNWSHKKNVKRLRKYLQSFSSLSRRQTKRLFDESLSPGFEFDLNSKDTANHPIEPAFGDDQKPLIRQVWIATAKLLQLRRKFNEDLFHSKMRSLKQLAYGASHEINNPLANIASRAQSLMTNEPRQSKRQQLAIIYSQAIRAHEMISDMMLFARPPEIKIEKGDIPAAIESAVAELSLELQESNIKVKVFQYPGGCRCDFDFAQMVVSFKAMIQNAMIAIGDTGLIKFQIWPQDEDHVGVSISDNGTGVTAEIAPQIFDPFFSGREAGRGLGFGLSKAWRIVESHGGRIELDDSIKRNGARFVITLPVSHLSKNVSEDQEKKCSRIDNARAA